MLNLILPPSNKPSWLSLTLNECPLKQFSDGVDYKPLSHKRIMSVTAVTAQFNLFCISVKPRQDIELKVHKKQDSWMNAKAKFLLLMFLSFRESLLQRQKQQNLTAVVFFLFIFCSTKNSRPILTTWFLICKESLDKKLHWQQQDFFLF